MPPSCDPVKVKPWEPDKAQLAVTQGPVFPAVITPAVLEQSQVWWSSALKACNVDKQSVCIEAFGIDDCRTTP